jgi:hypothetical protein
MIPTRNQTRRTALLLGKALVLVLLLVSPRALLAPKVVVHKAQDSKRPKAPRNVVRAEPVRIPAAEKQDQGPAPDSGHADAEFTPSPRIQALPRKAFTQLTKPDYLKCDSPGTPSLALSPPA